MILIRLSEEQKSQLWSSFRSSSDRHLRDRCQAILLLDQGYSRREAAEALGTSPRTVRRWVLRWAHEGITGLVQGKAPGKQSLIPASLRDVVLGWIRGGPQAVGLDRANWTYGELAHHLYQTHGIRVAENTMARFCKRAGVRLYRPTYRFLRADPAAQDRARTELTALKKKPSKGSASF